MSMMVVGVRIPSVPAQNRSIPLITILLLTTCLLLPAIGWATDCVDYRDYIHRASSIYLTDHANDVAVRDGHLFVVDDIGLHVFDVTDPENPQPVGEVAIDGANCLALRGEHAYVGCEEDDFRAVDISDPAAPWICSNLTIPTPANDIELDGDYAYLAVGNAGLQIVDISEPGSPDYYTVVDTPDHALDLKIMGDYAYIADQRHLVIIDITDIPTTPIVVTGRPGPYLHSIAVTEGYAFLLDSNFGIQIFDVSDPLEPDWLGDYYGGGEGKMIIQGDMLYAGSHPGLQIIDISVPEAPRPVAEINTGGPPAGIAIDGDHIYQAIHNPGSVDVIDISNPSNPPEVGTLMVSGWPWDIDLIYPYAYLSSRYYGLKVVDVTDPGAMVDMGYVPFIERAQQMVMDGTYGYVAGEYSGFYLVDLSTPAEPELISTLWLGRSTCAVAKKEGDPYVYAVNWDGLRIIDVGNPLAPIITGSYDTEWDAFSVTVVGNYALVSTTFHLLVFDVSDPHNPELAGSTDMYTKQLEANGDLVFISTIGGLWIYAAKSLPELELVGSIPLPAYPISIAFSGELAYLANGGGGLQILDLTDPTAPWSVGSAPCYPLGVFAAKEHVFMCGSSHIWVAPHHCSTTSTPEGGVASAGPAKMVVDLHQNRPNPFNPSTTISYTLTEPAAVDLAIYDCEGRLVRRLRDGVMENAGLHEVVWRGVNQQGRRVSSGVYHCRLQGDSDVVCGRMILLK